MKLYGLTGGIGSGKSTVSKMFEKAGIPVIAADYLNLVAAKEKHIEKRIFDRFGTTDRLSLRKIIFSDKEAKKDMEAIMHPEVQNRFFNKLEELSDQPTVVYDSALIFELRQEDMFEGIVSVLCNEDLRLKRILKRDGLKMTMQIARNIMACQVSNRERQERSDYIIHNDDSLDYLKEQVDSVILHIRQTDCLTSPNSSG